MTQEKATITIVLSDTMREIFKKMQFHEIPAEAKYVCFFEDGNACFIEEIEFDLVSPFPSLAYFTYYEGVLVETIDE